MSHPWSLQTLPRLDDLTLDVAEAWEVAYWTRKLDVDEASLRRASEAAGERLAAVVELVLVECRHHP